MFVKTKVFDGRTTYFLCIAEGSGSGWKTVEYSVRLGETLDLGSAQWLKILRSSPDFRSVSLREVLEVLEKYVADRRFPSEILAGLREAARQSKQQKTRRNASTSTAPPGDRRGQQDERLAALGVLGLSPGSSEEQIESAFRKAARRHHPDVGGDPARFRAIVDARNLLLGRSTREEEIA